MPFHNPYEIELVEHTVQTIYCPHCDVEYIEQDVTWWSTGLGEGICPDSECGAMIEVPLPEPDFYRDDRGVWKC